MKPGSPTRATFRSSDSRLDAHNPPPRWKKQMIDSAISDIENAEFVAIDLEFSGLFRAPSKQRVFENYYEECVNSVNNFTTIQLGCCPAWRSCNDPTYQQRTGSPGDPDVWCLSPYNFHVFPSSRKIFSSDSSTLTWLSGNGFSFDEWINKGFDYIRLALLQNIALYASPSQIPTNYKKVSDEGLQRIISAIVDNEKPIVVHNGLLDIMHIHDKFVDVLPVSSKEFCSEWIRIFSGGVYDTKHIATSGKYSVMQLTSDSGTVLSTLYSHLRTLYKYRSHVCLTPRYYTSDNCSEPELDQRLLLTGDYPLYHMNDPQSSSSSLKPKLHEAGYDALITAQVFLMQNELYHEKDLRTSQHSKSSLSRTAIPQDWISSAEFGNRFRDVLELVKISPGKLQLNIVAQSPCALRVNSIPTQHETGKGATPLLNTNAARTNDPSLHSIHHIQVPEPPSCDPSSLDDTCFKSDESTSFQLQKITADISKKSSTSEMLAKTAGETSPITSNEHSSKTQSETLPIPTSKSWLPTSSWAVPLKGYLRGPSHSYSKCYASTFYPYHNSSPKRRINFAKPLHPRSQFFANHKIDLTQKKQRLS